MSGRYERYAQAALERQCAELASTTTERNSALNRAAYSLGQFIGGGYLEKAVVEAALMSAASDNAYVLKDGIVATKATVRSGLSRGALKPRHPPEFNPVGAYRFQPDPAESNRRRLLRISAEKAERAEMDRRERRAVAAWDSSRETTTDSLSENYLRKWRQLGRPATSAIRDNPTCPWETGTALCMVAAYTDFTTGTVCGVHRTKLDPDTAAKIDRKMLGRCKGAAIMIDPLRGSDILHVAEGVETALAARQCFGLTPIWALGSSGAIDAFPVINGIKTLVVLGENDRNAASAKAVEAVGNRWSGAGRAVEVIWPDAGFKDLNDMVMGSARA